MQAVMLGGLLMASQRAPARQPNACDALMSLKIPQGRVVATVSEPAQQFAVPQPAGLLDLPAHCAVEGTASSGPDSWIRFALWMPIPRQWNGKMEAVGNAGYQGTIPYAALAEALARGYAALGADTGHTTPTGQYPRESLAFGAGHPAKIADWGEKSIHTIVLAAQPLVEHFEGRAAAHSYFVGCSTGGHQGLTEAQRYPKDFDGIVVGAPGNNRTRLNDGFLWRYVLNNARPEGTIPNAKLGMITRAAIASCDGQNGVHDGVIDDPRSCQFDPASLQCHGNDAKDCLTAAQVQTLRHLYEPAVSPRSHTEIYPAWPVGSESGWGPFINGSVPYRMDYWTDWVFDPKWDWRSMDWDRDVELADTKLGPVINATHPDLQPFAAAGGKLLIYQGWADPITSAYDTVATYEALRQHNPHSGRFARLYLIPGMGHCRGGEGTDDFDLLTTLEGWVERNEDPGTPVASRKREGEPVRTRPLCAFPTQAVYRGSGSPDTAASFECRP